MLINEIVHEEAFGRNATSSTNYNQDAKKLFWSVCLLPERSLFYIPLFTNQDAFLFINKITFAIFLIFQFLFGRLHTLLSSLKYLIFDLSQSVM